jgi:hypothetical protein
MTNNKKPLYLIVLVIVLTVLNIFCLILVMPIPGLGILAIILAIYILISLLHFLIKFKKSTVQSFCGVSLVIGVCFSIGTIYMLYARNISSLPEESFMLSVLFAIGLTILSAVSLAYANNPNIKKLLND